MNPHISLEFDAELDRSKGLLMQMGGLVEQQVNNACQAFATHDARLAESVSKGDSEINQLELELDEMCINVIARRQPAATDLRTLISIMNASTDLERIGDEADRIAKLARSISHLDHPADRYSDFRDLTNLVSSNLSKCLDTFARLDPESAITVINNDEEIDEAYKAILKNRGESMRERRIDLDQALNVMWSARALERIGDHSKNIAEYVVYIVKGRDIRHNKADALRGD